MPSPTEITVSQLSRLIGTPECPFLVDICIDEDFALDPAIIPGASRHSFREIEALGPKLQCRKTIIICQRGLKLSQGAAALLRANGIDAKNLEGGMVAWREAGQPTVPWVAIENCGGVSQTLWVTRQRPKVDRIACPWLIRRFIDRQARFLFVAPSQVAAVAERFAAIPFDVENVFWSHRGDKCTFDTMIEEFGLSENPALLRLAGVVRGADTNRHDLAPQCAGLLALSVGLSRQYRDDLKQLDAGILLYDALYRWARDGFEEGHDWPVSAAA